MRTTEITAARNKINEQHVLALVSFAHGHVGCGEIRDRFASKTSVAKFKREILPKNSTHYFKYEYRDKQSVK